MKTIGVMLDCSRNAVKSIPALKRFIDDSVKMNLNRLYLYMEDTYEIEGEPYFGHMRGRYSQKELTEIVNYGESKGVELVPCFQTLAHLNQAFRWGKYNEICDINDILLADDERTYKLIDKMFSSLSKSFKCDNFNVGMDEAYFLGRGEYFRKNGCVSKIDIFMKHLNRVNEIAHKYGKTISIWSDMLYKASLNSNVYYDTNVQFDEEFAKRIPKDITLIYWDYYHTDFDIYNKMTKNHKMIGNKVAFATGIWSWTGFAPSNTYGMKIVEPGIKSALANDIDDVIITAWGDNGGECLINSSLPSIFYASELWRGETKLSVIKDHFYNVFGIKFDDFMKVDYVNLINKDNVHINPSKYLLFNDPFIGAMDYTLDGKENDKYSRIYRRIKYSSQKMKEYSYVTEFLADLAKCLSVKACLGLKTRDKYLKKDKDGLINLIPEYKRSIKLIKRFYSSYRKAWMTENKSLGFEIQDYRIGGLILRLDNCINIIKQYCNGEIDKIDELNQPILDFDCNKKDEISKQDTCFNSYMLSSSMNIF